MKDSKTATHRAERCSWRAKLSVAIGLCLAMAVLMLPLAGCGGSADSGSSDTHMVTDMAGNQVEVPNNLTKYADGWYAHNEISIMFDDAKGMVATHCTEKQWPWMYKVAPNMKNAVSTFGDGFNFEELAKLGPQVIFDSNDNLKDKCAEVGIPLVNCMFTDYDSMKKSISLTAEVFGGDSKKIADEYNAELDSVLKDVEDRTSSISDSNRPTVMHGNDVYKGVLDGTETIIDSWIKACGGKNAVDVSTKGSATQTFSMEQIVAWNPDIIITGNPEDVDKILNDPNWQSIKAVQDKKVYVNPKGVFGWDRYGVEEMLQLHWAATIIQPDLFKDVNMAQEVKDFYNKYLHYSLTDEDVQLILSAKNPS